MERNFLEKVTCLSVLLLLSQLLVGCYFSPLLLRVLIILLHRAPMFSLAHAPKFLCRYNVAIKCATITPGTFGLLFC
jgi:hypothetical protein